MCFFRINSPIVIEGGDYYKEKNQCTEDPIITNTSALISVYCISLFVCLSPPQNYDLCENKDGSGVFVAICMTHCKAQ